MQASGRDIELLLKLQAVDLDIIKTSKKRAELPQRTRMAAVKRKQAAFQEKRQQVAEMYEKAREELAVVEEEDASLADKQQRAQELIDVAGTDFRSVESHSREMSGFAKRREVLSEKHDTLSANFQKVSEVLAQIDDGLAKLNAEAQSIRESFAVDDGELARQITQSQAEKDAVAKEIDAALLKTYENTAARTGGVAIGRLQDATCGVCRSPIEGGRLIELKASAPLGVCPACKRLLVVDLASEE